MRTRAKTNADLAMTPPWLVSATVFVPNITTAARTMPSSVQVTVHPARRLLLVHPARASVGTATTPRLIASVTVFALNITTAARIMTRSVQEPAEAHQLHK